MYVVLKLAAVGHAQLISLLGKDRKALAKGLGLSLKPSREGKHKRASKARKMEGGFQARGQPKSVHSPFASEVSSQSYSKYSLALHRMVNTRLICS